MNSEAVDNILKEHSIPHQLCIFFFMGVVAKKSFNVHLYKHSRLLLNKSHVLSYLSLLVLEDEYNVVAGVIELSI